MFCLPFLGPLHEGTSLKDDPMHFWIDKRSQTCGFNGRQRIPASLSAGRRHRRSKPMVTPVHRFQPIESRNAQTGHGSVRIPVSHAARLSSQPYITPSISYGASRPNQGVDMDTSLYLESTMEQPIELPPQPTSSGFGRFKYWLLALFSLVIVSVTVVKFYYNVDSQGNKLDISIASSLSLLAAGLMVSCMLSGCRSKGTSHDFLATHTTPQHAVAGTEVDVPVVSGRDEVLLVLHNQLQPPAPPPTVPTEPEQPPPPYHLAILLPPREPLVDETPPPTYDKAMVR